MTALSPDDVDRLLAQLCDQTRPDRPSEAEACAVIGWAERARVEANLLALVLAGDLTVRIGAEGEPTYRLTAQGAADVRARRFVEPRLVKGPDGQ